MEVPIAIEGRTVIDSGPFDLKTRSTTTLASEGNKTVGHEIPPVCCARALHIS